MAIFDINNLITNITVIKPDKYYDKILKLLKRNLPELNTSVGLLKEMYKQDYLFATTSQFEKDILIYKITDDFKKEEPDLITKSKKLALLDILVSENSTGKILVDHLKNQVDIISLRPINAKLIQYYQNQHGFKLIKEFMYWSKNNRMTVFYKGNHRREINDKITNKFYNSINSVLVNYFDFIYMLEAEDLFVEYLYGYIGFNKGCYKLEYATTYKNYKPLIIGIGCPTTCKELTRKDLCIKTNDYEDVELDLDQHWSISKDDLKTLDQFLKRKMT